MSDLTEHWPSSYADLSSDEENESISDELKEVEFIDGMANEEFGKSGKRTKRKTRSRTNRSIH